MMKGPQLPSDWRLVPLSSIADVQTGLALGKGAKVDPVRLPYLRVANVQDGFLDLTEIKEVEIERSQIPRYSLRHGDVLMTEGGDFNKLGRGFIWHDEIPDCLHQNHVFVVRPHPELQSYFLASLTSSEYGRAYFQSCSKQSTNLASINSSQLKAFPVPLPPIKEQEAIMTRLSTWDRGIRQLSDLIAAKVRFKQGLMQQLLTGQRRFPEFNDTPFVEYHVGDVLNETFRPVVWNDDELYRLASIRRHSGGLFWREALQGNQIKVKKLHSLEEGDFLISHIQAAYGAMGLVPAEFADGKVSDMYTILTPKDEGRIDMRYIDYLSQMKQMRHQAYLACNGFFAERLRLNFDPAEFMKQKILLPEFRDEQSRIADLLDTLVGEIRLLERELDALKQQKKGLMQKLLTGEVRVKLPKGTA